MPDPSPVVLAVDQGTSSTKGIAVDADGSIRAQASIPVSQQHPRPGWVEQDAEELAGSVLEVLRRLVSQVDAPIVSLGLSTQRESAVVWERSTGRPVGPVLGWQDRRTSAEATRLLDTGHGPACRRITGLPIDPMFSALKLARLLDEVDPDRRRSAAGELAVGTVDAFLLHRLTGEHRIEAGNASRTLLVDVETATWSAELLDLFRIPEAVLPVIARSDAPATVHPELGLGGLAIGGVLGDSHAALYGHGVRTPGDVKATYGTGSSIMGLLPPGARVGDGLARTIAWWQGDAPSLAVEGNILSSGSTLVWLAEVLGETPGRLVELAQDVDPLHGVDLVPAFAGLAAPWWSETAEASLTGFTLGTSRAVLARAAVDSVALQIDDVLRAVEQDGVLIGTVLADGGPSANDGLMQLQADLAQRRVRRSPVAELSALGVAELAAATAGAPLQLDRERDATTFEPRLDPSIAAERRGRWDAAVRRVLHSPSHDRDDAAVLT